MILQSAAPAFDQAAIARLPFAALVASSMRTLARGIDSEHVRLRDFFRPAWGIVNPGVQYVPNWHNDLIAEHLEAVHLGQIKLLDIEMPPRMGKSFHVSVAFPAWEWTEDAGERFLFSSYNQKLCNRHSLDRRAVISSAWYQKKWGEFVTLAPDQNLKTEFQNTARGHMITAPFGSSGTGSGGRRLVIDDPLNPKQASSKVQREAAHDYYRGTLSTRLDDEHHSAIIMVAQRTDVDDLQGKFVNEKDGWTVLKIPIQAKSRTVYIFPISKTEKVYEAGELLCPARKSQKGVDALRKALSNRAAAQLDQEPEAASGNLFPRNSWKKMTEMPTPLFILNAWDTAVKEREENDPSAGLCIVLHEGGFHFCKGVTHGHMRFSELKLAVRERFDLDRPDAVFIEDKSSGQQLIQEFQDDRQVNMPLVVFNPDDEGPEAEAWKAWFKMDKYARAQLVQPLWAAGRVSYDPNMEGAADMIAEFASFPKGLKDRVDAGVHGVRYLSRLNLNAPPTEEVEQADGDITDGL
ncbi:MAG: hypothetical protein KGZ65_04175 [Sphingomonadales bacterium]|nr:hypothetical protein [Sphingomonadaceae bacterium]MBS3930410.1 hypothetical protein [Sphingomonadales bacterium]